MSDLFSNLIERAQGVAPALRPLHAFYRQDSEDDRLPTTEEPLETQPQDMASSVPRIHNPQAPRDRSAAEFNEPTIDSLTFNPASHSPSNTFINSLPNFSNHTETVNRSLTSELAVNTVTPVNKTGDGIPATQAAPAPPARQSEPQPPLSVVKRHVEGRAFGERPNLNLGSETTSIGATPNAYEVDNTIVLENIPKKAHSETQDPLVWDPTAVSQAALPARAILHGFSERSTMVNSTAAPTLSTNRQNSMAPSHMAAHGTHPCNAPLGVIEQEQRHVTVSIGRLEVRVNSSAHPKPQSSTAPVVSTLNDYLRERQGGSR